MVFYGILKCQTQEDKAKREEQILNLQKAQYALAMAENQRPKLVNYMPDTIVIQCVKVTITVKIRWDGQDRGKTDFRLENTVFIIAFYQMLLYNVLIHGGIG